MTLLLSRKGLEFRFGGLARKVGYVNFPVHISSFNPDLLKHSMRSNFQSAFALAKNPQRSRLEFLQAWLKLQRL
jgi:hypothetical protein